MRGHPPSAAAAPLLRRTGRQAFPTPRGGGKSDPKGGLARPPGGQGGAPRLRYAGDAPAAPDTWALALRLREATRRQILRHCGEPDLEHERSPIEEASDT